MIEHEDGTTEYSFMDLQELRETCDEWSQDLGFSDAFQGLARAAVAAIADCLEDDVTTHQRVKDALETLFGAVDAELVRMEIISRHFCELDFTEDPAAWRRTMGELLPLLSDGHVLGLRVLMMDAAADFRPALV